MLQSIRFLFWIFLFYGTSIGVFGKQADGKTILKVLGTVQDGGSPHLGCEKKCCSSLTLNEKKLRKITALEVYQNTSSILFEATPDIIAQWSALSHPLKGIFITHAHMGHYSGLLQLGREALGANNLKVYAMPKMSAFIRENAPWSQLVELNNIKLLPLNNKKTVQVIDGIKITPVVVPHRDEFSETVGYTIQGPNKTVLFIPDIDKWDLWNEDLVELLNSVDLAFLDATFFDREEVNFRPFSEIPHPFVKETIKLLGPEAIEIKNKVYFIHMNHTNPLLNPKSKESLWVETQGFHIARFGQEFDL